ncbi:phospholipase D family protein [Desulfopila inferna]|uniref:phospholipase D family protein n=1 Tax=Desulfopila inferna TaxID=468528 RepID=UPI0019652F5C|nr:phospholipase D family protein [Desulfopila inferna]MBM9604119.1 phospholipase D family protein [Desulfopila inferna]
MKHFFARGIRLAQLFSFIFFCSCAQNLPAISSDQPLGPEPHLNTTLADFSAAANKDHPEKSGLLLLRDGQRALAERMLLADMAEQRIDAQYYIWNSDRSGRFLMQGLLRAADRGVTVRLLLDDFSVGGRNDQLMVINHHPNLEVRIYNPFIMRSALGKWLNFAFDFDRLNRRMHNKTFAVDGAVAITGGRNIGDEYFAANEHINFSDMDVLSVGPVVTQVNRSFNEYWNSPWAVPVDELIEYTGETKALEEFMQSRLESPLRTPLPAGTEKLLRHYRQMLLEDVVWAQADFMADAPGGTQDAYTGGLKKVAGYLRELADDTREEILIESAYFVLDEAVLQLVEDIRRRGVVVRALTNSMASNDVLPNHVSYAMVRKDMLRHGIELYEMRPDAKACLQLVGLREYCDDDSALGLHAKTAVFDRRVVYVGSLNFNLRSAYLNTEAAMIVDSPVLADELADQILENMQHQNSWQVLLEADGLVWVADIDGQQSFLQEEPSTSWLKRTQAGFFMLLPGALYY